jgi:hypothetical protein
LLADLDDRLAAGGNFGAADRGLVRLGGARKTSVALA